MFNEKLDLKQNNNVRMDFSGNESTKNKELTLRTNKASKYREISEGGSPKVLELDVPGKNSDCADNAPCQWRRTRLKLGDMHFARPFCSVYICKSRGIQQQE